MISRPKIQFSVASEGYMLLVKKLYVAKVCDQHEGYMHMRVTSTFIRISSSLTIVSIFDEHVNEECILLLELPLIVTNMRNNGLNGTFYRVTNMKRSIKIWMLTLL